MIKVLNIAPNCCIVRATQGEGLVELFYSYDKLVAACFIRPIPLGQTFQERYRIQPSPSATTTRHLKKMGVYHWPLASPNWLESREKELSFSIPE